jgi:hypothetical protein
VSFPTYLTLDRWRRQGGQRTNAEQQRLRFGAGATHDNLRRRYVVFSHQYSVINIQSSIFSHQYSVIISSISNLFHRRWLLDFFREESLGEQRGSENAGRF